MITNNVHHVKQFEIKDIKHIKQDHGDGFFARDILITTESGETFEVTMIADDADDLIRR